MTRVLALRALGLGDLLTAVPALRGLRRAWPGARLVLAGPVQVGAWLVSLGVVDEVVAAGGLDELAVPRGNIPDVAVNLHGRGPQSHRLLATVGPRRLIAYFCPEAQHPEGPRWRADEHEVDRWIRLSQWAGGQATVDDLRLPPEGERGDHVVVHPGAASGSRCWPPDRWAAVAAALVGDGHRVVVTGSPGESARCAVVAATPGVEDWCGRLDLPGLGRLVGTARLLLSGDTGVAHVATAFGTPSVTLFGPVSPALWGPRIDRHLHRVLWRGDPATPRPGDPHAEALDGRLAAVVVTDVLAASRDLLDPAQAVREPRAAGIPSASQSSTGT